MAVTHEFVLAALTQVDSRHGGSLVAKGWVGDVVARDGHVLVTLEVPDDLGPALEPVRADAERVIHKLSGVVSATVVMTGGGGGSMGTNPLERRAVESCSAPEGEAVTVNDPTPMDEMIAVIKLIAAGNKDANDHLAALGARKNFPPKLAELARLITPLLRGERG